MFGLTVARPRLDVWPEATVATDTDIVVAGISLRRLADVCGTPTSHSAASVRSNSRSLREAGTSTGVLVTRVLAVADHYSGVPVVQVDARLDHLRLVWSEARVIGAKAGARSKLSLLVRKAGRVDITKTHNVLVVDLPARITAGDLIAIPSRPSSAGSPVDLHPVTGLVEWRPGSPMPEPGSKRHNWWEVHP